MKNHLLLATVTTLAFSGCAGFGNPHNWIPGVIEEGRQVELVQETFQFTEGPVGTADGGLYFTDSRASRVYRVDPNGKISLFREPTGEMNGLALGPKGELIGVETAGKRVSRFNPEGPRTELTRGDGVHPLVAPSDLIVDAKGGIYFTDPRNPPLVPGRKGQIYYLPPGELKAIVVDESMTRPNGLTLTLDGKRLIVADTVERDLSVFDVGPDGRLGNKRPYARLLDIPEGQDSGADGIAIDREGRLFVTSATGVQVFDRSGRYLGTIRVPRKASNVAFAGPDKRVLYITAGEGLYRIPTLTQGPDRPGK